ncbi:hypothetical protein Pla175_23160 [Pirellulimonas nuda]|uniref:Uncharacterized protein n=1 Tax=Pirellulimonas nuda TaxID=2528009 RepID=A0A518DBS8_9BACT|nr:hypothetical protein Pla175_23160 [Pirellulimonas nuda]
MSAFWIAIGADIFGQVQTRRFRVGVVPVVGQVLLPRPEEPLRRPDWRAGGPTLSGKLLTGVRRRRIAAGAMEQQLKDDRSAAFDRGPQRFRCERVRGRVAQRPVGDPATEQVERHSQAGPFSHGRQGVDIGEPTPTGARGVEVAVKQIESHFFPVIGLVGVWLRDGRHAVFLSRIVFRARDRLAARAFRCFGLGSLLGDVAAPMCCVPACEGAARGGCDWRRMPLSARAWLAIGYRVLARHRHVDHPEKGGEGRIGYSALAAGGLLRTADPSARALHARPIASVGSPPPSPRPPRASAVPLHPAASCLA